MRPVSDIRLEGADIRGSRGETYSLQSLGCCKPMTVAGFPLISGVRVITWSVVTVDASCCFSKTRKPLARMLRLNNPAPAHTPAEAMNERRDGSLAT
jgi:hypothetical protein